MNWLILRNYQCLSIKFNSKNLKIKQNTLCTDYKDGSLKSVDK